MLRITAGDLKGRELKTPPETITRPSSAKLRQALFNSVQWRVPGGRVLDLFAGSGALGLEAFSRGALEVYCVEKDEKAYRVLNENIRNLKVHPQVRAVRADVFVALKEQLKKKAPFDLIIADPPYEKGFEIQILEAIDRENILKDKAILILEWSPLKAKEIQSLPESVGSLTKIREQQYGDSFLSHYQYQSDQKCFSNGVKKETMDL
jgi:16S rRNA (guanine(966)-N(2))-methyltransferase RsmD